MKWLIYELKNIPDLSLVKYQSLSESGVEGVLEKHASFLRQWQKISATYQIGVHLFIQYLPKEALGERIKIHIGLSYENEFLKSKIMAIMEASPLEEFYNLKILADGEKELSSFQYQYKTVLKKCERKRLCEKNDSQEAIPLFYVETWEANENARLYDLYRTMKTLDTEVAYIVSLQGRDSYEEVYQSLEKPITFLRNKTVNRGMQGIKLQKDEFGRGQSRDVAAEETLKVYEEFLKSVSTSPCYQANISVLSDDILSADILLNTVCGESIEEGGWDVFKCEKKQYGLIDDIKEYYSILPKSLSYWTTYFTLEEIIPFFRLPALFEGEFIEIKKETEPRENTGELFLGKNLQKNNVNLPIALLKKHAFICGVPGAGKTNTMLHLCYSLWKKCQIPFLVLEPAKKEYRALAQTDIEELLVFSPSSGSKFPLAINPFEFVKGMSLSEHIQNLMDVFEGAFPLTPPLPALLDRAIEGVYENHGWDTDDVNDGNKEYPTMRELYERLEYELEKTDYDGEVRGNMKSALEMRIGSLLRRDLGNVFDVKVSTISPEELMKVPIIIEMESMGTGPSNFMTLMLCTLIREVLRADPFGDSEKAVRHVLFIEEAHNLIASQTNDVSTDEGNPKVAATNFIVKMLAEVRALREGIIIADQLPSAMPAEVLKNTGVKIVHRLTAQDDRGMIGATMSANNTQMEELATFMPGNALITYEGLLRPFRMQIAAFELKDAPTTEELFELMRVRRMQCEVSKFTISIRLEKLKEKWLHEWEIAMVVYKQLETDCGRAKVTERTEELEQIVSAIVRDQIGMEKCLDILKTVKQKYAYTLDLAMEQYEEDVAFYHSMEKGLKSIIGNVQKMIMNIRK